MISIIVIAFNSLRELELTLPALRVATNALRASSDVEVVLSDDGSTDGTQAWVQENYPEIQYVRHENLGRGPNRNFGAARAKGEPLIFMDADIQVEPSALLNLWALVREDSAGVCFGNIRLVTGERVSPLAYYLAQKFEKLMRRFGENLNPWDSFSGLFCISRKLFTLLGGFSTDFRQYGGEDTEFFLRCHQAGARFFFAKDGLGWHHQSLDLESNLRRAYWGSYSNALIARETQPALTAIGAVKRFGPAWYDRIFAFLTTYKLWNSLICLHPFFALLPAQNKAAFYFYHFIFEEMAQKGREAGKTKLNP